LRKAHSLELIAQMYVSISKKLRHRIWALARQRRVKWGLPASGGFETNSTDRLGFFAWQGQAKQDIMLRLPEFFIRNGMRLFGYMALDISYCLFIFREYSSVLSDSSGTPDSSLAIFSLVVSISASMASLAARCSAIFFCSMTRLDSSTFNCS